MSYSDDWILRQIEIMIDAIIKRLLDKKKDSIQTEHIVLQNEINSLIDKK